MKRWKLDALMEAVGRYWLGGIGWKDARDLWQLLPPAGRRTVARCALEHTLRDFQPSR